MLPLYDVSRRYLSLAEQAGNHFQNSKYCILEMLKGHPLITRARTYQSHFIRAKEYSRLGDGLRLLAQECPTVYAGKYKVPEKLKGNSNG
eukprot:SAG22_NODE_7618_length_723_cov_0.825321_1_plen_90_part_00